jgi:hypothetical protein
LICIRLSRRFVWRGSFGEKLSPGTERSGHIALNKQNAHLKNGTPSIYWFEKTSSQAAKQPPSPTLGKIHDRSHLGSQPMRVIFELQNQ